MAAHGGRGGVERLCHRAGGRVELALHAGDFLALGVDLARELRLALAIARDGGLDLADALLGVLAQLRHLPGGGIDTRRERLQLPRARADLLAMPTLTRTALPIEQDLFDGIDIDGKHFDNLRPHWFPWTMLFNMTGHPAVSMPSGFDSAGLPIGLQLVGRFRGDAELLRAAALFEGAHDLLLRWPD